MKNIAAKILSNEKIGPRHFKMAILAPQIARCAKPGQFMQVRCSDAYEPLLRRPFSIHRVKDKDIEILYEVVGKGSNILSKKKKGELISILGPLGSGFTLPLYAKRYPLSAILIAGGIGGAPLLFLAEELARRKIKTTVLIGAKTKRGILCDKDFKRLGAEVHIATDDGTSGCRGFVSRLFEQILRTTSNEQRATVYACGPNAMLKCIAQSSTRKGLECQVSLEEHMACGIGVCLGCAVKLRAKTKDFIYKLACKDGPVFTADQIIWS